ncbi:MAG: PGF-pre-PGF domain-containing protein [Methermicoccaceae archaeon]
MASHSYSHIGAYTEATSYAVIGLNATGLSIDNSSVYQGVRWLRGVYQSDGSWGYTKSSAVAIAALTTTLKEQGLIDLNVTVEVDGTTLGTYHMTNSHRHEVIPLNETHLNATGALYQMNHTINLTQRGVGTMLVGVSVLQVAPKSEAILKVPADYIDPLATDLDLTVRFTNTTPVVGEVDMVNVTLYNYNATEAFNSLIIEVPIPNSMTCTNQTVTFITNGTPPVNWFANSTYNSISHTFFIYPEVLNGSEAKSFYFNVTLNDYGNLSLSDVKGYPMYNPTWIAEDNTSVFVKGYDNVTFGLMNESGVPVDGVLVWDGSTNQASTSGIITNHTVEGDYELAFFAGNNRPVMTEIEVQPDDLANYTATLYSSLPNPKALFFENNSSTSMATQQFSNGSGYLYYNGTVSTVGGVVTIGMEVPQGTQFHSAKLNGSGDVWHNDTMVYVTDELGGDAAVNITFFDPAAPTVTIQQPADGSKHAVGIVNLQANAGESAEMWYSVDGNESTHETNNSISTTLTLSDGQHNITVYAKDMGANIGTDSVNVTIDTTAPVITFNSPEAKAYATTTVSLDVSTNENATIWYNYNGTNSTPVVGTTSLIANMTNLSEGATTVYVYAKDEVNHLALASQTFSVDTNLPVITINSPVDGQDYTRSPISLDVNVTDDSNTSIWYSLDGGVNSTHVNGTTLTDDLYVTTSGNHNVTVYASDEGGNVNSEKVDFTYSPPQRKAPSLPPEPAEQVPTEQPTEEVTPTTPAAAPPAEAVVTVPEVTPEEPVVIDMQEVAPDVAEELVLSDITLDVNIEASDVEVSVEQTQQPPAEVPDVTLSLGAGAAVYSYVSISTSLPEGAVNEAQITFTVPESWYTDNGLDPHTTEITHFNEATGEWESLTISSMEYVDGEYRFTATTPGFSVFSVIAKAMTEEVPEEVPEEVGEGGAEEEGGAPGFEAILAIGALLSVLYLAGRRRN